MPTSRTVPPARRASWVTTATLALIAALAIGAAYFAGKRAGAVQELLAASPSAARGIAAGQKAALRDRLVRNAVARSHESGCGGSRGARSVREHCRRDCLGG